MSRWLNKFLQETDQNGSDKPDKEKLLSGLSGCPQGLLKENLRNMSETGPDISDRFGSNVNMSDLSGSSRGLFGKNLGNTSGIVSDKPDRTDRFNSNANMSVLSVPSYGLLEGKVPFFSDGGSLFHDFEERVAIAEYDGQQTNLQAQRIAYLDAFISVLVTLPQESFLESSKGDWLDHRIKEAKSWLSDQGLEQPE